MMQINLNMEEVVQDLSTCTRITKLINDKDLHICWSRNSQIVASGIFSTTELFHEIKYKNMLILDQDALKVWNILTN